jgi:hypothetical protein
VGVASSRNADASLLFRARITAVSPCGITMSCPPAARHLGDFLDGRDRTRADKTLLPNVLSSWAMES